MNELHEAPDYRSFLKLAIELKKNHDSRFGYSELSRKAGLKSRSYPREVILGKKNLSIPTAESFSTGLNLTGELKTLFLLLVEKDDPNLNNRGLTPLEINRKIKKIRNRIRELNTSSVGNNRSLVYQNFDWVMIRSSISDKSQGTSLEKIVAITGLSNERCIQCLDEMLKVGLVSLDSEKKLYSVDSQHIIMHDLRNNDFFKKWYIESSKDALSRAENDFSDETLLFLNSVFMVRKDQRIQLKKELISTILKFIDDAETTDGDQLAKVTLSFT